jgi:tubulin-specific chaperone D
VRIWSILTECLDDYSIDSRGDVGSWIRMSACESLVPLYPNIKEDIRVTIGKLLRLSVERMDRVRSVAGRTLCVIIPSSNVETDLKEFIDKIDGDMFAIPSKIYPAAVQLLSINTYRQEVLTGFIVSAGGLGESLVLFFLFSY